MKYKVQVVLPLFILCMLLSACVQPLASESQPPSPALTEMPLSSLTPTPGSTGSPTLQPLSTPEPLPEGSPLTLAGQALYSAVMMDEEETYRYSFGEDANLEGWFQYLGLQVEAPFYEYYDPDGTLRLTLWYAPESGMGLGIRYRNYGDPLETFAYGFGFRSTGCAERDREQESFGHGWYRWEDPYALPKPDFSGMTDYQERQEYDETGRLVSLTAFGTLEDWSSMVEQPMFLCGFSYDYDTGGVLRQHHFATQTYLFGTTTPGKDGYYDDQGRLAYERGYITHGSTDTYYIYEGDAKEPSYALYLDESAPVNFPLFVQYP